MCFFEDVTKLIFLLYLFKLLSDLIICVKNILINFKKKLKSVFKQLFYNINGKYMRILQNNF